MDEINSHPRNPFRRPDWRWGRATLLGESTRAGRDDDAWVRRARRLQKALARFAGVPDHPRVVRADPAALGAYRTHLGDARRRWEVEARSLAGQDDAAIAARIGVLPEVIEAYEAMFYNVRSRLGCSDWVTAFLFGPRVYEGLAPGDIEPIWKVFAYQLGPLVLDVLVDLPQDFAVGESTSDRSERTTSGTVHWLGMAVAAMTLRVDVGSAPKVIQLSALIEEFESVAKSRVASVAFAALKFQDETLSERSTSVEKKSPTRIDLVEADTDVDDLLPTLYAPLRFTKSITDVRLPLRGTG